MDKTPEERLGQYLQELADAKNRGKMPSDYVLLMLHIDCEARDILRIALNYLDNKKPAK